MTIFVVENEHWDFLIRMLKVTPVSKVPQFTVHNVFKYVKQIPEYLVVVNFIFDRIQQ